MKGISECLVESSRQKKVSQKDKAGQHGEKP
jgi:hypothetical protein